MAEDRVLLKRYSQTRDADAFAELVRRYAGMVYSTCLRVTRNGHDAEDISQECFMELSRSAGSITTSLPGWLHKVARCRSINLIRRATTRGRYEEEAMSEAHNEDVTWEEIAPLVDESIEEIAEELRVPMILHYFSGRTQEEVAEELGVNQSTVSRRLEKGVWQLRGLLRKAGIVSSATLLVALMTEKAFCAAPAALMSALGKMAVAGIGAGAAAAATTGGTAAVTSAAGASSAGTAALLGTLKAKVAAMLISGAVVAGGVVAVKEAVKPEPEKAEKPAVTWTTSLLAGEPKLANATKVFPTAQPAYKRSNQFHAFAMRLSPDGKHVLYTRPVPGAKQPEDRSTRYEVVLRELESGKETVLPIEPLDAGWQSVPTRFNLFDPAGTRLVLPNFKVEKRQIDEHTSVETATFDWSIFNVTKGEMADTTLEGDTMGLVKFTADGQALLLTKTAGRMRIATKIISLSHFKGWPIKVSPKSLTAPGWIQSVNPAAGVGVFFVPPEASADPPKPYQRMQMPPIRLVLWDLKADQELAEIPTHPRKQELEHWETQWTANGRYLYYVDVDEVPAEGEADRPTYRSVTRIWDRQAGKPAGMVSDVMPVGPGPGQLMVLAKRSAGGFLLHDAASGKEYPLGDASKKLIHAYGAKVIYAQKSDDSDAEDVFTADVIVPTARE